MQARNMGIIFLLGNLKTVLWLFYYYILESGKCFLLLGINAVLYSLYEKNIFGFIFFHPHIWIFY
jgi:hypothetical protein